MAASARKHDDDVNQPHDSDPRRRSRPGAADRGCERSRGSDDDDPQVRDRRLYGRGSGRPLSTRQQELVDRLLPQVSLPPGPIALSELFSNVGEVRLEIGFGAGDHLIAQAERTPGVGFIGVEFFLEGVAKALSRLERSGVSNVVIERGDGRDVLDRLPDGRLERIYVLFPDPWPKTRHHKRRFIQPETVAALSRTLAPGGVCRVATDVKSYVSWTLRHMRAHRDFRWTAQAPADWRSAPADHIQTRYERKNLGDCPPNFLDFVKR